MGQHSGTLWPLHDPRESFQPLAVCESLGAHLQTVSVAYHGDIQMIDSSSIRVHQHRANGQKRGKAIPLHRSPARWADHQDTCAGRVPSGPIRLKLTEGQAHDGRSAADMFGSVGARQTLIVDRAYNSGWLRAKASLPEGRWPTSAPCRRENVF